MKIRDMFKNANGEVVTVVEVDETRKTCMIEFEDGRTRSLTFSTLKDKRRWTKLSDDDQYVAEIMKQKEDLGIECPSIESVEIVSEDSKLVPMPGAEKLAELKDEYAGDGTPLAEVGKEIAEQAKQKAKKASKKNLIEYNGKSLTLHGWAKELNVPFGTLYARVTRFNWTYEEALSGIKNK